MVLIAEDQAITALELKTILKKKGFRESAIFARGSQAMEFLVSKSPDFALLDVKLADSVSGIDVAKKLQQKKIPFIFVSAFSDPENLRLARDMHPSGIITKPFNESDIIQALDEMDLSAHKN